MDIMCLAKQFQMETLAQTCECFLKNTLGLHNIFPFLKQASAAGLDDLHQFGIDFCLRNWTTVAGKYLSPFPLLSFTALSSLSSAFATLS